MDMKYAEDPFTMGMFFLINVTFKMGAFCDPNTHAHPGSLYWSRQGPHISSDLALKQGNSILQLPF